MMRPLPRTRSPTRSPWALVVAALLAAACDRSAGKEATPTHEARARPAASPPATGPQALASGAPSAGPAGAAKKARGDQTNCKKHGPGAIWRLKGTLGGQPVTADAVRVNAVLRLAVLSKDLTGSLFEGPIDAQGNFDLRRASQGILSIKGQIDSHGQLTASAERAAGGPAPLTMTGVEEVPGPQPRILKGYALVTESEKGASPEDPASTRTVPNAQLILDPEGAVSVAREEASLARGACTPGLWRSDREPGKKSNAAVKAAAARLLPDSRVLASEVVEGSCERGWGFLEVILLVDRHEMQELVTIRLTETVGHEGSVLETAEAESKRPYPPRCK